ncbi:SRPBCC family protein [Phycicoccus sp. MAQZ13P-2]|uniref:SRPBCC family protein n=1 Tax=Phycicoccus mangrovi TaxID=2840470 RepID=UPI001BFFF14F|nr:SRPBCC family protein [Phycicoccus mangrovi]MBT9256398.1 SRPBCC family protein [Phycicoccus mangrovi]MBT9275936.1 SRPBCC family protein [Phycicoccus mangrovi]
MELTHDFTVPADVDTTWATFMDLERVGSCFPGATVTEVSEEGFAGTVKVKLGPIALQYAGTGHFVEKDDAAKHAVIEAKGKDKRGNGTAGATVRIQLAPDGTGTRVEVVTDLAVTGKPAQFGRGVMQDVSDKLLGQFVGCIEGVLGEAPAADDAPSPDATAEATDASTAGAAESAEAPPTTSEPTVATVAPTPTPAPRPAPRPAAKDDDALDLGATVLPVLVKSYAPYVVVGVIGLVIGWLIGNR